MVKKNESDKTVSWYEKNYKKMFIVPIFLFLFSIVTIYQAIENDGTPIYRDVSLKGGLSAIIETQVMGSVELKGILDDKFLENSFVISNLEEDGKIIGLIVDTDMDEDTFISEMEVILGEELEFGENYSSNFISPTLSLSFFKQAIFILVISFVLMSVVIFIYFRAFVPSGAVVLSALFDLIVTIGVLNFFEVHIGVAGIGALLMIIGYSIDTDVLLTNRMFKEYNTDSLYSKLKFSFETGLLMTTTTLVAGIGALFLTNSEIIFQIALILVVGLLVDFISTWFSNAGILYHWLKKREERGIFSYSPESQNPGKKKKKNGGR
jgi:preprotein translocase subunit SecF